MKLVSDISCKIESGQSKFLILFLLSLLLLSPTLFSKSIFAENSDMIAQEKKYTIGCTPTPPDALGPFYKV